MNNFKNNPEISNANTKSEKSYELSDHSLSYTIDDNQINSTIEINNLKEKVNYYEKHLFILLTKYQEAANKFTIFRDFFLNYHNGDNDITTVLKKIDFDKNSEENLQIANLLEENSQLRINFNRSTDLLRQQKEVINKLKESNKELNSFLEMTTNKDLSIQRIEELEKENKDLQSLYEMMMNESDDLNSKNQLLHDQIAKYKSMEYKLREEQAAYQQKIYDLEDELTSYKYSHKANSGQMSNGDINKILNVKDHKLTLGISSSISFDIAEKTKNDTQVHNSIKKSKYDENSIIEELEAKAKYLESELDETSKKLTKVIRQNNILKEDHKKNWLNLQNAKKIIEKYIEVESILRMKLETAGIEIPCYDQLVFEEI